MLCIKVRNFLPQAYVEKENKLKVKSMKRVIYYLLIFNIFILPININSNESVKTQVEDYTVKDDYENIRDDLFKWLSIDTNIIKTIKIDNNNGEVIIDKKENAYYLEGIGFTIDEVKHIDDNIVVKIRSGGGIN